jgi:hypothetical protein
MSGNSQQFRLSEKEKAHATGEKRELGSYSISKMTSIFFLEECKTKNCLDGHNPSFPFSKAKKRFQQMTCCNYLRSLKTLVDSYLAFNTVVLTVSPSNSPDRSTLVRDGIFFCFAGDDVTRLRVVVSASQWT